MTCIILECTKNLEINLWLGLWKGAIFSKLMKNI